MTLLDAILLFLAGVGGGAVNAVAGGGSFISFPMLIFQGVPAISANASSAVALWPGSLASTGAYLDQLRDGKEILLRFGITSFIGGLLGAGLLLRTPGATFSAMVPWLLLSATLVFAFGGTIITRLRRGHGSVHPEPTRTTSAVGLLLQLVIATYGGFFGGGMGIMMLASFTATGMDDIHVMNGLKNWCAVWINGVAVVTFIVAGIISWPHTLVMLAGAVLGGFGGAHSAKRLDPVLVRRFVIAIGFGLSAYFFVYGG